MSGNPFDQFDADTNYAVPVLPTEAETGAAQPLAPKVAAAPPPNGNPFDQFDAGGGTRPARLSGMPTVGGFSDELPRQAATKLAPEDEQHILAILATHPIASAASEARRFAAEKGFSGPDNFDRVIEARSKGASIPGGVVVQLPKSSAPAGAAGAAARGIGDSTSFGFLDELGAVADTLGGTRGRENVWNSSHTLSDIYSHNLDANRGILDADEADHPQARLVGQLIGGMMLPTGLEGVGLKAGKSVLALGGTMREARAAAASAVRSHMAKVGGAYGVAHGAGSADGGLGDRALGALTGAAEGAAGGYGMTAAGQAIAKAAPVAAAALARGADAVGLGHGDIPEEGPDYAQIARDLNIRRTPATDRGPITGALQSVISVAPGASLAVDAAKAAEVSDVGSAARRVAQDLGTPVTRADAGESLAQGAKDYERLSAKDGGNLYDQRDALIGGANVAVPTDNTKAAIDDIAARFPTSPAIAELRQHPAIRAIEGALPGDATTEHVPTGLYDASGNPITRSVTSGGEPLTLGEVTEALSHVRGVSRRLAANKDTAPILARVDAVKRALNADVQAAAARADEAAGRTPGAEGSAVKAHANADAYWADRKAALDGSLKRPLASADDPTTVSGESVYNQVSKNMDKDNGNLAQLRDQWFRIPDNAKRTFAATKIDDMGRATPGNQDETAKVWSYDKFLDNWNSMSSQARNIVFGANADKQLGQIAAYSARLRQTGGSARITNRIQQVFNTTLMGSLGYSMMHGDVVGAGETLAGAGLAYGGAKLFLATPKMRDWTVSAMKAIQAPRSDTALRAVTQRLSSIAATEPAIADQVLGLQQHILNAVNDNFGHAAAASQPDKKKNADNR